MKQNCQSYGIPSKFLKLANTVVAKWLAELFIRCINEGVFPDSLKISCITPIPKIRNPQSPSDNRPISVLPTLSKVFEKLLYQIVYYFLTQNNAIAKRQYGFRTNHSTDLAITILYDEYINNIDKHLITCSLFLDLSKAFDCCDHEILLQKVYHYGIRETPHKLFCRYLSNRKQCTKLGETKSSYMSITCGVSQGSVLGPLLFLIYIHDITQASSFNTTMFADDINLHMSASNVRTLQRKVKYEIKILTTGLGQTNCHLITAKPVTLY